MRNFLLFLLITGSGLNVWGKDIILIKKFSPDDKVREWLRVIDQKKIKTTLLYPFPCSGSEKSQLEKLLKVGIISLAIEIENEPFWLLLEDFSQDITAILANARLQDEISLTANSLFLRQPFSPALLRSVLTTGYRTVFNLFPGSPPGDFVRRWDNLLMFNISPQIFSDSDNCKNYLATSSAPVVILYLDETNPFGPQQFAEIAAVSDEDRLILPSEIVLDDFAPVSDINMFESPLNLGSFPASAFRWKAVVFSRSKFQQYKNSGRADIEVIRQAQSKIYRLYSADWLLAEKQKPEVDDFWKEWRELLRLLGVSPSEFSVAGATVTTSESLSDSFKSENIRCWAGINPENILSRFRVEISTSGELIFRIETSTPIADDYVFDIYIDLNNRRGAGSTRLLFGEADTLGPEDGWEWVLTIAKNSAILYKSRNFQYEIARKYPVTLDSEKKQVGLIVPRQDIGFSPRYWGFLVLVRRQQNNEWEVLDVLESEEGGFRLGKWKMLRW